jgi:hypothetical protein
MARTKQGEENVSAEQSEKVSFLTWFCQVMESKPELKAQHMSAVQAYFKSTQVPDPSTAAEFEKALAIYGIK